MAYQLPANACGSFEASYFTYFTFLHTASYATK